MGSCQRWRSFSKKNIGEVLDSNGILKDFKFFVARNCRVKCKGGLKIYFPGNPTKTQETPRTWNLATLRHWKPQRWSNYIANISFYGIFSFFWPQLVNWFRFIILFSCYLLSGRSSSRSSPYGSFKTFFFWFFIPFFMRLLLCFLCKSTFMSPRCMFIWCCGIKNGINTVLMILQAGCINLTVEGKGVVVFFSLLIKFLVKFIKN